MTRILLDVDGVICDFVSGYLGAVAAITGRKYTAYDVTDWDFTALQLTTTERRGVEEFIFRPGWVRDLSELPGAALGIEALRAAGAEIAFVTSPWPGHPTWSHERATWLGLRWPGVPIVSTSAKWLISGDVLIDDKPEHIDGWKRHNPNGCGLLWVAPYNRQSTLPRVPDWDDVLSFVFGPAKVSA